MPENLQALRKNGLEIVSYELAVWNLTEVNRYVRITNGK